MSKYSMDIFHENNTMCDFINQKTVTNIYTNMSKSQITYLWFYVSWTIAIEINRNAYG